MGISPVSLFAGSPFFHKNGRDDAQVCPVDYPKHTKTTVEPFPSCALFPQNVVAANPPTNGYHMHHPSRDTSYAQPAKLAPWTSYAPSQTHDIQGTKNKRSGWHKHHLPVYMISKAPTKNTLDIICTTLPVTISPGVERSQCGASFSVQPQVGGHILGSFSRPFQFQFCFAAARGNSKIHHPVKNLPRCLK